MYLKIMNGGCGDFEMIECAHVRFEHRGVAIIASKDGMPMREVRLTGNAYILNEDGKTVDSFRAALR